MMAPLPLPLQQEQKEGEGGVSASQGNIVGQDVAPQGHPAGHAQNAQPPQLQVLFRDEHYVVINKPAGLLVHPTPEAAGETDTVLSRLSLQLALAPARAAAGNGGGGLWPVHRLDRGTSGALVLALSSRAAAALCAVWQRKEVVLEQQQQQQQQQGLEGQEQDQGVAVRKEYLALVFSPRSVEPCFECAEPLTKRKVQTVAARKRQKKKRRCQAAASAGTGGGDGGSRFELASIPDGAKRRYVGALVQVRRT
jgi:23S rRNA-/tRNA-specific pseudouridylate synthase